MVDIIKNFKVGTLDTVGRSLVWDNHVIDVSYYDCRSESWTRDFEEGPDNPFINGDFGNATVTGTGRFNQPGPGWYEDSGDASLSEDSRYFRFGKIPMYWEEELFATYGTLLSSSTVTRGTAQSTVGDYFIDADVSTTAPRNVFPQNYDSNHDETPTHATSSGVPGAPDAFIIYSFGSQSREVAGFLIDSFDSDGINGANSAAATVGTYIIEVATTGDGLTPGDYTVLASGTYSQVDPLWVAVEATEAKYVKLRYRNRGYATESRLKKFYAFSQETIDKGYAAFSSNVLGHDTLGFGGRTFRLSQDVDFSGIDYIYFDIRDQAEITSNLSQIVVGGDTKIDFLQQNRTQGERFEFLDLKGVSVDVSQYASVKFGLTKTMTFEGGSTRAFVALGGITTAPPWYSEEFSEKRGSSAKFPDEVMFVVDKKGMSIVDVTAVLGENELNPKLWMRFDLGENKMLQHIPREIDARNGKVYLATSRGLIVIDFLRNCAIRFDERGPQVRYGIDFRNENSFEISKYTTGVAFPQYTRIAYTRFWDTPVIPALDIYSVAAGTDSTFGDYVALGTSKGLVVYNDAFGSSAAFYQSANTLPVYRVQVEGGRIWYSQGYGTTTTLNYIETFSNITAGNFSPDATYYQNDYVEDSFSGDVNLDRWDVIKEDPGMNIYTGESLTISGTHLKVGRTGLISKSFYTDRDFEATIKVKIKDFPPDARGGFRFGLSYDYLGDGGNSLRSVDTASKRRGLFLSAHNVDAVGGKYLQNDPFDTIDGADHRQWYLARADRSTGTNDDPSTLGYTEDGVYHWAINGNSFTGDQNLIRTTTAFPICSRNFTARVKAQLVSGFDDLGSNSFNGCGAWFGVSNRADMVLGTSSTGDYINAAMVLSGHTSVSGVPTYGVGRYSSTASPDEFSLGLVPMGDDENEGHLTSPYREWRIEYVACSGTLTAYIEDEYVGEIDIDQYPQPPHFGLTFGLWAGNQTTGTLSPNRTLYFKDFQINYPELNSNSTYKYGVEVTDTYGAIGPRLVPFTVYSGISLNPDTSPESSTLGPNVALADKVLHSAGLTFTAQFSVGTAVSGISTVEGLYVYDTSPSTNGWSNDNDKWVEVWLSEDNSTWTLLRRYNINLQQRTTGVTKIPFEPAVETKFIKLRGVNTTGSYAVSGGSSWSISEIQPLTTSGTDFSVTDATADADYRDWKLIYKSGTREVKGYIDNTLVSTSYLDSNIVEGQFVLMHDLTAVVSGTSTSFEASVKDFEVTFSGTAVLPPGILDSFYLNSEITGNNTAYTLFASTSSGVYVSDFQLGPDPAPVISTRQFGHTEDIFGESSRVRALFSDIDGAVDDGLLFAGTGIYTPTKYIQRYNKINLIEGNKEIGSAFGGNVSYVYHPGMDSIVQVASRNVGHFSMLNLGNGLRTQTGRVRQIEETGLAGANARVQFNAAKMSYVVYDDSCWLLYIFNKLVSVHPQSGDSALKAYDTSLAENIGGDSGHHHLVYVPHSNSIFFGQDYINGWDVEANTELRHPRNWQSAGARWNRFQTLVPWDDGSGFVGGGVSAVYCDYDRCVYFLGNQTNSYVSDWLFYRWDPDKDYLELITTGNLNTYSWPISDETLTSLTPLYLARSKSAWLVYDPFKFKLYAVNALESYPQFYCYDVLTRQWTYEGEAPPFIANRAWPSIEASTFGTNHAVFDSRRGRVVFLGAPSAREIYEYVPSEVEYADGFDYMPSRDGLPTVSGVSRQFTKNGATLLSNYTNSQAWGRDFYFAPTEAEGTGLVTTYTIGPEYVTVSAGNTDNLAWLERSFYVSSEKYDGDGSFDISARVAFPRWDTPFRTAGTGADYPDATFVLGMRDGLNQSVINSSYGREDANLFQEVEVRVGVSGTAGSTSSFPFKAHLGYTDGQNVKTGVSSRDRSVRLTYDSYNTDGVIVTPSADFRELRLKYDHVTDVVQASIDGQFVGSTELRRKFNPGGTRFYLGMYLNGNNFITQNRMFVANVKDISVTRQAWDYIEDGRLIVSISGAVGSYYHDRWDTTIASGMDWVLETEAYVPTHRRFDDHSYVVSLAGVGDGRKLIELAACTGPGQLKHVALTGDIDNRHDFSTYLSPVQHLWDDIDAGKYRIVRDTRQQLVQVYFNDEATPSISVDYDSLPEYRNQHAYYGKVNYGDFEKVFGPTTFSGTWTANPNFTGSPDPTVDKNRWLDSSDYAMFATVTQVSPLAQAFYTLDSDLGTVDLYAFHVISGFDFAKNTPYTITASGVAALPGAEGEGNVIYAIENNTDHLGNPNGFTTTVRIDQRRFKNSKGANNGVHSSGWVYLGRYISPTQIVVTADAQVGTTSTQGVVCAGAVAVDPGKRGMSTADLSIRRFRYTVGETELPDELFEPSGISVLDLEDNELIDFYGKQTAPALPGTAITSGDRFDE